MAFKMKGWSPFKQKDDKKKSENIAHGVKKSDSVSQNEHNEAVSKELANYRKSYSDKHGSSSGGTDAEWNAYQDSVKVIQNKYIN